MILKNKIITFFILLSLCSCSKSGVSSDITSGETIYIVSSEASGGLRLTSPVKLNPYEATMFIDKKDGNLYNIRISYDFIRDNKHFKFYFVIHSVQGTETNYYAFKGEHLEGNCTFGDDISLDYEDVSVVGTIGFNRKSNLSVTGTLGNKPFQISIISVSASNPGSMATDIQTKIQKIPYEEHSFANTSGQSCELAFGILEYDYFNKSNSTYYLADEASCSLGFLSSYGIWESTCSGVTITFKDGSSSSLTNLEMITMTMSPGNVNGCLKYLGKETDYYLSLDSIMGVIDRIGYIRYFYEILPSAIPSL